MDETAWSEVERTSRKAGLKMAVRRTGPLSSVSDAFADSEPSAATAATVQ
jgi:hypothetical protein